MSAATSTDHPLLVRLLIARGAITEEHLEDVGRARAAHPESLEEALVVEELVAEGAIAEAWAEATSGCDFP